MDVEDTLQYVPLPALEPLSPQAVRKKAEHANKARACALNSYVLQIKYERFQIYVFQFLFNIRHPQNLYLVHAYKKA